MEIEIHMEDVGQVTSVIQGGLTEDNTLKTGGFATVKVEVGTAKIVFYCKSAKAAKALAEQFRIAKRAANACMREIMQEDQMPKEVV